MGHAVIIYSEIGNRMLTSTLNIPLKSHPAIYLAAVWICYMSSERKVKEQLRGRLEVNLRWSHLEA